MVLTMNVSQGTERESKYPQNQTAYEGPWDTLRAILGGQLLTLSAYEISGGKRDALNALSSQGPHWEVYNCRPTIPA